MRSSGGETIWQDQVLERTSLLGLAAELEVDVVL